MPRSIHLPGDDYILVTADSNGHSARRLEESQKETVAMTGTRDESRLNRLEYFIELARKGKKVRVEVALRRQLVEQKVHPDETDDNSGKSDMYLLIGDYLCECEGEQSTISKIYVYGRLGEPVETGRINRSVANERLKMDYQRLDHINIAFSEKYFET